MALIASTPKSGNASHSLHPICLGIDALLDHGLAIVDRRVALCVRNLAYQQMLAVRGGINWRFRYVGRYMANWMCFDCYLVLDAEDEGQEEPCPKCGNPMGEVFLEEET